jgi:hypothetical protein
VATEPALTEPAVQHSAAPEDLLAVPTVQALTNEERWRRQQKERTVFETMRTYTTSGSELWWYDPVNQQHVILGTIAGDFQAQAQFTLAGQGIAALEVPYRVNQQYGLTSLSPALLERIQAAGYGEWIETYVFAGPDVRPR